MPMTPADTYNYTMDVAPKKRWIFAPGTKAEIIEAIFATSWSDLAKDDHPVDANAIDGTISGQEVEIKLVKDHNIVLKGAYYWRGGILGQYVVIFLSGSGDTAREYGPEVIEGYLTKLHRRVKGVLCVDYRGFGRSDGGARREGGKPEENYMPSSWGLYSDAMAMIAYVHLHKRIPMNKIVLHGYSLGSGPATEMAKDFSDLGGLILHGPMRSIQYNAKMGLIQGDSGKKTAMIGGWLSKNVAGFQNRKKIKDVNIPICITCGPKDVDMWPQAQAIREECDKHKKFCIWSEHDGEHLDTGAPFRRTGAKEPLNDLSLFFQALANR